MCARGGYTQRERGERREREREGDMTAVCCYLRAYPTQQHRRVDSFRCCSNPSNPNPNPTTPQVLKIAVAGVTELLRLFSSRKDRLETDNYMQRNEVSVSNIDDVVMTLQSDYENAYFVTGTELYSRNLKLLVPFFDHPSIVLQKIEKGSNAETNFVLATWKLRTYLRLPWRPLISIDGSTVYDLDDKFKIVRHAESWDISALQAIGQIFTPSFGKLSK
ncbi:uncharacterized protein LOC130782495 isoform X2 [Actinidia eriantha]|uniref:uncharacterized protein LOC130782495 isoform X2 n=1 Tax=Actinidia eriantha TaxID=165200 RepID=UPI0025852260|nr:uncharacterized protein LOC130782495 isoform X2 [Actinidia eriantha]